MNQGMNGRAGRNQPSIRTLYSAKSSKFQGKCATAPLPWSSVSGAPQWQKLRTAEARLFQFCAPLLPGGGIQYAHATVGFQLQPGYDLAPQFDLLGIAC